VVRAKLHEPAACRRIRLCIGRFGHPTRTAGASSCGIVMAKDPSEPRDDQNQQANLAMVGLQVAVGVGVGFAIGWWLDKHYGWGTKGQTIGSLLGLAGGLYLLIKDAIRINKD
jgi:F0F1-type ATP synthase assembly protein I